MIKHKILERVLERKRERERERKGGEREEVRKNKRALNDIRKPKVGKNVQTKCNTIGGNNIGKRRNPTCIREMIRKTYNSYKRKTKCV